MYHVRSSSPSFVSLPAASAFLTLQPPGTTNPRRFIHPQPMRHGRVPLMRAPSLQVFVRCCDRRRPRQHWRANSLTGPRRHRRHCQLAQSSSPCCGETLCQSSACPLMQTQQPCLARLCGCFRSAWAAARFTRQGVVWNASRFCFSVYVTCHTAISRPRRGFRFRSALLARYRSRAYARAVLAHGLYQGLQPQLVKGVLSSALMLSLKESIELRTGLVIHGMFGRNLKS